MKVSIIVAQSKNRVIGNNNELPWKLPKDLQYFKEVTLKKPIIMGRKTYESIGRPLPGRTNIVISSNPKLIITGVEVVNSLEAAIAKGQKVCEETDAEEIIIMGGSQIYNQGLSLADTLYITEVDAVIEGDAYFPVIDYELYEKVKFQENFSDAVNQYNYNFAVYEKVIV